MGFRLWDSRVIAEKSCLLFLEGMLKFAFAAAYCCNCSFLHTLINHCHIIALDIKILSFSSKGYVLIYEDSFLLPVIFGNINLYYFSRSFDRNLFFFKKESFAILMKAIPRKSAGCLKKSLSKNTRNTLLVRATKFPFTTARGKYGKYHTLLASYVENFVRTWNAFNFTYQHMDCCDTLVKFRLSVFFDANSGRLFLFVERSVSFNWESSGGLKRPALLTKQSCETH